MASVLISSATLLLPGHALHNTAVDILIENGVIKQLTKAGEIQEQAATIIEGKSKVIAPGFFDLHAHFGEPGLETKEDFATGTASAAAGGFTEVCIFPNTKPVLQSQSEVSFVVNSTKGGLVNVLPVGALSKGCKGEELAELYDMKQSGAVAFSDGTHSVQQAGLMSRALLYAKGFDGLVISFAQDESIAGGHQVNEGDVSTFLGMKGVPNLAESLMVARDLGLAEYNDTKIHFTSISTEESVDLIKKAKNKGVKVTCDVAAHQLLFSEEELFDFDSNYKVSPPLRTKKDIKALKKALKDGVIDAVISQHSPHEIEFKDVEFQIAAYGISSLQTTLPFLLKAGCSEEEIVEYLAIRPRKVMGVAVPTFEEGSVANAVLFDSEEKWMYDEASNRSKGRNNPWYGTELTGKVIAVFNNKKFTINK